MDSENRDTGEGPGRWAVQYTGEEQPPDLVTALVSCLAEAMATDTDSAGRVLHDAIDPVVFEQVYTQIYDGSARFEGQVTFPVGEYEVTITTDGRIEVVPF